MTKVLLMGSPNSGKSLLFNRLTGLHHKVANFPGITVVGLAPFDTDYVALFTLREEYGFINYLNLFVNQQVRTGRYAELYTTWIGGELPNLTVGGVYR